MKNALNHFRKWQEWRKRSLNSGLYKIFVLFGLLRSPTFELFIPAKEWEKIFDAVDQEGDR